MAFVNGAVGAGTFVSAGSGARCGAAARGAVRAQRRATVAMTAFSSLDAPERAVSRHSAKGDDKDQLFTAIYRQVFGNAYLMEEDLAEIAIPRSKLIEGTITVREFIREAAKSEMYRKRFFETTSPYRFVELCTKHFLGRGPLSQEEVSEHVQRLVKEGYNADIDSYLDSEEYLAKFGENTVPRFVFEGAYVKNDYFNRLCAMRQFGDGCFTDTRTGSTAPRKAQKAELTLGYGWHVGAAKVARGIPRETVLPKPDPPRLTTYVNSRAGLRLRIKVADNSYQVFEIPKMAPKKDPVATPWKAPIAPKKFSSEFY
mmetsp:Transcript_10215/g.27246  ORF Transcript_10215/g.27246 Transcript_10215/m.27246 type:complete len:314 (+) Transcript_10215:87-1028(+)